MTEAERRDQDRAHWRGQAKPMPAQQVRLELSERFDASEYAALARDRYPEAMEDKWLILWNDPWLDFHRSWTGYQVYRVRFERDGDEWGVAEAWASRDPEQYVATDATRDARILRWLLRAVHLGQPVPYPLDTTLSEEDAALEGWATGGRAMTRSDRQDLGTGIHWMRPR